MVVVGGVILLIVALVHDLLADIELDVRKWEAKPDPVKVNKDCRVTLEWAAKDTRWLFRFGGPFSWHVSIQAPRGDPSRNVKEERGTFNQSTWQRNELTTAWDSVDQEQVKFNIWINGGKAGSVGAYSFVKVEV